MTDERIPSSRRRRHVAILLATGAACVSAAIATPLVLGSGDAPSGSEPRANPSKPQLPSGRCPHSTRPLPPDGVAAAAEAALAQAPEIYGPVKNLKGMRLVEATWAPRDDAARGGYARVKCGRRIQRRTVVVSLDFPNEKGASLREGILLVSHTVNGYEAWALLH
jgi:hypothetical protein